jgi:hypothetical protein
MKASEARMISLISERFMRASHRLLNAGRGR